MDADVPTNYVAQLSGHKYLKSLDSYKTASAKNDLCFKPVITVTSAKKRNRQMSFTFIPSLIDIVLCISDSD